MSRMGEVPRPTVGALRNSVYSYHVASGNPLKKRKRYTEAECKALEDDYYEKTWEGKLFCNHICQELLEKTKFSKSQKSKPAWRRACETCVSLMYFVEHSQGLVCEECQRPRGHGFFPREVLKKSSANCKQVCFLCIGESNAHHEFFRQLAAFTWSIFEANHISTPCEQEIPGHVINRFNLRWPKPIEKLFHAFCKSSASNTCGGDQGDGGDVVAPVSVPSCGHDESAGFGEEHCHRCKECELRRPRDSFTRTQLKRNKSDMRCRFCADGPDVDDEDQRDPNSNPPGWHSEAREAREVYYDKAGRVLQKYRRDGIPRKTRLEHIRYSQKSCSGWFKRGRNAPGEGQSLMELVRRMKKQGSDSLLKESGNEIRVCKYRGKYWTLDHRRLWALKEALPGTQLIWVRYFEEPGFLEFGGEGVSDFNEFIRKFDTDFDGRSIRVRW